MNTLIRSDIAKSPNDVFLLAAAAECARAKDCRMEAVLTRSVIS